MKIGILTIQSNNYGNRLQNYAMQETLRRMGNDTCTLLRSASPRHYLRVMARDASKRDRTAAMHCFSIRHIRYGYVVSRSYTSRHLDKHFDRFVIGSDQVWNPTFWFNSELDYLPMVEPAKKIAYAASFGVESITDSNGRTAGLLNAIPHVSMREEAGAAIINRLTGRKVPVVLDPTLLLETDEWAIMARPPRLRPQRPYLLKYALGVSVHNETVERMALGHGLEVFDMLDSSQPIGPAEFIWLFANARAVCTDSFHGSVFAVLHHKPLVIFERQSDLVDMSSRFDTLCRELGLESNRISSPLFDENAVWNTDWMAVEARLAGARAFSLGWLEDALNAV